MTARRLAYALGFIAVCAASNASAAPPARILLSIGQNIGAQSDEPLRYAERDAQHVSELFTAIGDYWRSECRGCVCASIQCTYRREQLPAGVELPCQEFRSSTVIR